MDIAYIKTLAKKLSIEDIKEMTKEVRFKFTEGYTGFNEIYKLLIKEYKDNITLYFGETPFFAVKINTLKKEELLNFYKELLNKLVENSQKK